MKGRKSMVCAAMLLCFVGVFSIGPVSAKEVALSDEARTCLGCHGKHGLVKTFQSGESVAAYVDTAKFKDSVHNFLTCTNCHSGFSQNDHPNTRYRSKKQYQIQASRGCRHCHTVEQLRSKPIHANLFLDEEAGKAAVCTECHSAHYVMPVNGGKVFANETQYCMSCHGLALSMTFRSGEQVPLTIEKKVLEDSAHARLSCSDCHYGFSSEEHPLRTFRTKREYTLGSSESCRRCHFDKYTKILESVHYTVLSQGNQQAPVCTDCHGAHSVARGNIEKSLTTRRCQGCHPSIYEIYSKSVHGKALFDENNQDVPVCIDCHTAHNILLPTTLDYHEKIPALCSGCHGNKALMEKYGLSTNVVKSYLSDFHGVTLGFYKKQREALNKPARPIAVCTDCHGIHGITSTRGTELTLMKEKIVKRCQQCHKDAPKNFPDAWLSHYEPSLKSAPLTYLANLLYRIFIPILLIGLFLQILLHIWRYAADR